MGTARTILRHSLQAAGVANAALEADWIVQETLNAPTRAAVLLDPDRVLEAADWQRCVERAARRAAGEPLQYVLGSQPFHDILLHVGPGVLIPRPETEQLVEISLALDVREGPILDLCTGSGAILLAMAQALQAPSRMQLGIDISLRALAYARENRARLGLRHVELLAGDLFAPLHPRHRFALITANPPYVSPRHYAELPADVRDYEPRLALWADNDGLAVIRRIVTDLPARLLPGGWFVGEISCEHGPAVLGYCHDSGLAHAEICPDCTGRPRFLLARA